MEPASSVLLYVPAVVGWSAALLLVIYNVVALFLFLYERADRGASGLAVLSWVAGLLAVLGWCAPCLGGMLALTALAVARHERIKIYRGRSPLAGATPVRLATLDGSAALVLHAGGWVAAAVYWFAGQG
jgi:hypothetical protein